jgi:bifunctional DNase/RNase
MRTIYKYELSSVGVNTVDTHEGATVLSAKIQNEKIVLYLIVDTRHAVIQAEFAVVETGKPLMNYMINPSEADIETYVDTVVIQGGAFVYHVFSIDLPVAK